VATVREAGFPALEVEERFGVVVPANTPAETIKHLNAAIRASVSSDRFTSGADKLAVAPAVDSPEQFAQLINLDFDRWGRIVRGGTGQAQGEIIEITGRVLNLRGEPVRATRLTI
jgi:tripartite-type tricarboxylate transporter receptor subunit TctC